MGQSISVKPSPSTVSRPTFSPADRLRVAAAALTFGLLAGLVPASAVAAQATVTASHEVTCLAENGRIDTWLTNTGSSSVSAQVALTGLAPRDRTIGAGSTERVTITGRPDGDYDLTATAGGVTILAQAFAVTCDPPPAEVAVNNSCLSNNGRVDVTLTNLTATSAQYSVLIGALAPRSVAVVSGATGRITATGRRDGPLDVQVTRNGVALVTRTVDIVCDALLPGGLEAEFSQGCLGGNGFFRFDVSNSSASSATYEVQVSGLAPRQLVVGSQRLGRFTITGRPDGPYAVAVRRNDVTVLERTDVFVACDPVVRLVPQIQRSIPHDTGAFTQGLVVDGGRIFESTGAPAGFRSTVRELDPVTGDVLRLRDFGTGFFGEGLAVVGDRLFFLSWREGVVRVLDRDTFDSVGSFTYDGQGWGLCFDGTDLVMSNGTADLTFRDPDTFEVRRQVTVTLAGDPVIRLNELECVAGRVWANVWLTNDIVGIEPLTGLVRSVIDVSSLEQPRPPSANAVANGIAWDSDAGRWLLTGKEWPTMYEVLLVPQP